MKQYKTGSHKILSTNVTEESGKFAFIIALLLTENRIPDPLDFPPGVNIDIGNSSQVVLALTADDLRIVIADALVAMREYYEGQDKEQND